MDQQPDSVQSSFICVLRKQNTMHSTETKMCANVANWECCHCQCPTLKSTLPCQWPSGSVYSFQISISKVQLTSNQNNRCARTEVLDFLIPHGFHMIQGVRVSNGKTEDNNIGPGKKMHLFKIKIKSQHFCSKGKRNVFQAWYCCIIQRWISTGC